MESKAWENPEIANQYRVTEIVTGAFVKDIIDESITEKGPYTILDNACGTGIVTAKLYEVLGKDALEGSQITCADISAPMIAATEERAKVENWTIVKTQVADASKTDFPDSTYTHVITNFGLMFFPKGSNVVKECYRILKPGGKAASSTWTMLGWVDDMREAIEGAGMPSIPDKETFLAKLNGADWYKPEYLKEEFLNAGFSKVETRIVKKDIEIPSAVDYAKGASPMMVRIIGAAFWKPEEVEKFGPLLPKAFEDFLVKKYGSGSFTSPMHALLTFATK